RTEIRVRLFTAVTQTGIASGVKDIVLSNPGVWIFGEYGADQPQVVLVEARQTRGMVSQLHHGDIRKLTAFDLNNGTDCGFYVYVSRFHLRTQELGMDSLRD